MNHVQPPDLIAAIDQLYNAQTETGLKNAFHHIILSIYRLLQMYTTSALTDFCLTLSKEKTDSTETDLTGTNSMETSKIEDICDAATCMDKVLVSVETLHNLPNSWTQKYRSYFVEAHLMYGLKSFGKVISGQRPLTSKYHFQYVSFQHWVSLFII